MATVFPLIKKIKKKLHLSFIKFVYNFKKFHLIHAKNMHEFLSLCCCCCWII